MYNVIISKKVHDIIHNFIDSYKNVFLKTFTDTWIYYEKLIRESYVNSSIKFQNEIYDWIEKILKEEKIYWYKQLNNNNFRITLTVWNYRLYIQYTENNNNNNNRFVEQIIFNQK